MWREEESVVRHWQCDSDLQFADKPRGNDWERQWFKNERNEAALDGMLLKDVMGTAWEALLEMNETYNNNVRGRDGPNM